MSPDDEPEAKKQSERLQQVQVAAMKKQSTFSGHLSTMFACVTYQMEGNRLATVMGLDELLDIISSDPDTPDELMGADPLEVLKDW